KRLNVLARDNFQCQDCQSTTETLHVHHKQYEYGKDPWDYDDSYLITLCEYCHQSEEHAKQSLKDVTHDLLIEGHTYRQLVPLLSSLISASPLSQEDRIHALIHCAVDQEFLKVAFESYQ